MLPRIRSMNVLPFHLRGPLDDDALEIVAGRAPLGDQRLPVPRRQGLRHAGDLLLGDAVRPRRRQLRRLLAGEREVDLGALASGDAHRRRRALETGADALHRVLAGGQVVRLETALILARHHEGQVAISVLQFHHGTDDRLAAGIIHHTLYRALVVRRAGGPGDKHGPRRNSERETSRDVPECHMNSSVWLVEFWLFEFWLVEPAALPTAPLVLEGLFGPGRPVI